MASPGPGIVVSVNLSERKTVRKTPGAAGTLVLDRGFEGDAHAGDWHRQVSLLAEESIEKMVAAGLEVGPGDFAENITTRGLDLMALPVGTSLKVGEAAVLEISQIGKVCHTKCAIYYQAGDCVMPREGLFAVVRTAGEVRVGDAVEVVRLGDGTCDRTPAEAMAEFEADKAREAAAAGEACAPASAKARFDKEQGMAELRVAIITASDRCAHGIRQDTAGPALARACEERGWDVIAYHVCADDEESLVTSIVETADMDKADIILTCGGTGFGPRDVTPEATLTACERLVPGIPERIRSESMRITARAMLSRAVAGIRGRSLIVNLPGSEKGALEAFGFAADQFEHAVEMMAGGGHDAKGTCS